MKTIRTKVYKFNELSKEAQQNAIGQLSDININLDFAIQDAYDIGLNITDCDLDSASFIRGVRGEFITSAGEVCEDILLHHDKHSETYKTALKYKHEFQLTSDETNENELCKKEDSFLNELLIDYTNIMQSYIEFQGSENQIVLSIEANEYDFTKDGKLFHA